MADDEEHTAAAAAQRRLDFIYNKGVFGGAVKTLDPDKIAKSYAKASPARAGAAAPHVLSSFDGEFEALSLLSRASVLLRGEREAFPSAEHAFQASKTTSHGLRERLRQCRGGLDAKRVLSKAQGAPSSAWKGRSAAILRQLVLDKFVRHAELRRDLVKTKDRQLVYLNAHGDRTLGVVGRSLASAEGQNALGHALEDVRSIVADWEATGDAAPAAVAWAEATVGAASGKVARLEVTCRRAGQRVDAECVLLGEEELGDRAVAVVGKLPDSHLVQGHPTCSRRHALVGAADAAVVAGLRPTPVLAAAPDATDGAAPEVQGSICLYVVDLASGNGTYVNGVRLQPFFPYLLGPDAEVRFGASSKRYAFRLEQLAANATEADLRSEAERRRERYARLADPSNLDALQDGSLDVYVGNLPFDGLEDQAVADFFDGCGEMRSLDVPRNRDGTAKGFAFLRFRHQAGVVAALQKDRDLFMGRGLRVKRSDNADGRGKKTGEGSTSTTRDDYDHGKHEHGHGGGGGRRREAPRGGRTASRDENSHHGPSGQGNPPRDRSRSRDRERR